ncbi:MAG: hypothetical protein RL090_695, partial [Bacteroidota bacterium]
MKPHCVRILTFLHLLVLAMCGNALAQQQAILKGVVSDNRGRPLPGVNVAVVGRSGGMATTGDGKYSLNVPSDADLTISYSSIGFTTSTKMVRLTPGETKIIDVTMEIGTTPLPEIEIRDRKREVSSFITINPKILTSIPNTTGSFEVVLKTLPGVISNNELSSQYSVRGGNFDENLVYVNDIEVF